MSVLTESIPEGIADNLVDNLVDNFKENNDVDSDNEDTYNYTVKNKKKHNLIDSESEDDEAASISEPIPDVQDTDNPGLSELQTPEVKKKSRLRKVSDDSDDEISSIKDSNDNNESNNDSSEIQKSKSKLNELVDTDSEDESKLQDAIMNEGNDDDEDALQKEQAIRLKNICDSESSADEAESEPQVQINRSKKQKSARLSEKKMSGRDAVEQMRQIKSASQKMVRESRVSLPYHMPKQHTLKEFLKRRSLVPDVIDVPVNKSTTFAIKMSSQELVKAAERLKEREKEIEEFYKEDESEEELEEQPKIIETQEQQLNTDIVDGNQIIEVEPEKQSNADVEEESPTVESSEEILKIEELRNVLIKYSCGNDSNMEQLIEQPEQMETEEIVPEENPQETLTVTLPENLEEEPLQDPEEVIETVPQEPENKEDEEEDFTETFTRLIENPEVQNETPNKDEDEVEKKLKNLQPIISLKKDFTPRLTGDGGDFIVLDDGLERSKGVSNLMKRFFLHTSNKSAPKKEALDGTTAKLDKQQDAGVIEMEHEPDEAAKKNLTPGLKFKKLKANLEEQIVLKRLEEWKKKQDEFKIDLTGEKTECGMEEQKILDDEEEEEDISDEESSSSSEDEDDDEEEDDVALEDKPKSKSAFMDDEAEVSEEDDEDDESEEDTVEEETEKKKQPLKRIIQAFNEDSEDDENEENKENRLEENDEEITAYQPQRNGLEKTPLKPITENKSNDLSTFLTPTFHLTALQGMPSATKSLNESPGIALSPDPSPLRTNPLLKTKTKLFTETEDVHLEELENLCSGAFTGNNKQTTSLTTEENNELLNLCSGRFTGLTAAPQEVAPAVPTVSELLQSAQPQEHPKDVEVEEDTQAQFQITFDNDSLDEKLSEATSCDIINSQNSEQQEQQEQLEQQEQQESQKLNVLKFVIASSDEEDTETETDKNKKKTKRKRKYIIDDISISDVDDDEGTANINDFNDEELEDEEEMEEGNDEEEEKNVDYDSEENEVEYEETLEPVQKITTTTSRDYFEAEAELSGSDWDSADEDEKGLDAFEEEDGDADKINAKRLQRELGRIHAHTVLEEDKRDVRLLQELLLEDGELHGAGRERKFKWKNADSTTWNDENRPKNDDDDDDDVTIEDTENEMEWRKMRHERETFLKEQQLKQKSQNEEDEDLLTDDSQIMQLGREALERSHTSSSNTSSINSSQQRTVITENVLTDPDIKLPFSLTHKRGSFLMRSETTLARLAEITRTTAGPIGGGAKNSRNFVFTTIDKTDSETFIVEPTQEKKRKAEPPKTPKILKKMRVAESPAPKK